MQSFGSNAAAVAASGSLLHPVLLSVFDGLAARLTTAFVVDFATIVDGVIVEQTRRSIDDGSIVTVVQCENIYLLNALLHRFIAMLPEPVLTSKVSKTLITMAAQDVLHIRQLLNTLPPRKSVL